MRLDRGQIEAVDEEMAAVLRTKTGAQRLAIADGLFAFARQVTIRALQAEHPDWSEPRINREAARRLSHGSV